MASSVKPTPSIKARFSKSTAELVSGCQKAAKSKQWDVAIQLASAALQESDGMSGRDRVTILDTRVALYLRMNEVDLAIKDAKAMIRQDRTDGRGYIRCGQTERARGHFSAAVNFYRHGLKHVQWSSQYVQSITKEMDAVQEQIRIATMSSKPVDPMEALPLETAQHILSFISYKQHVRLLRVCRAWNRLLRSLRPLTDTLAFPDASKDITPKMLLAALRRLKVPIAVYATRLNDAARSILANRLQAWQNFQALSTLEVQSKLIPPLALPLSKYNLKSLKFGPSTFVEPKDLSEILKQCPGLETAHFTVVRAFSIGTSQPPLDVCLQSQVLQHLHLDAPGEHLDVTTFFARLPGLRSLSVSGVHGRHPPHSGVQHVLDLRYMVGLETLRLIQCAIPKLYLPPSLKDLDVSGSYFFSEDHLTESNPTTLPNLERLTIWRSHAPPPISIFSKGRGIHLEKLSELTMLIDQQSESIFATLMESGWLAGVRRLHLAGSAVVNRYAEQLPQCLRSIEDLCLEETSIDGTFLADLLNALELLHNNKLKKITLKDCYQVSRDVVPWGKARGVEINLVRTRYDFSGRQIRDAQ
ncbi:hypothetical protein EDD37DRAFT_179075 [Exophiala viscosa]|uniref:uncharacterized protein n=1 Tax=Exophiala viscosa TaxID=2486360 RepID=UPI0021928249|nr:hypothetical protein EDD37DRAFT_179075 [Exophiala viscosa]